MGKAIYLLSFLALGELDVVSRETPVPSNSTDQTGSAAPSAESVKNDTSITTMLNKYTNQREGAKLLSLREDKATRWILSLNGRVFVLFYTLHGEDSKIIYMRTSVPQPQPISAKKAKRVKKMSKRTQVKWDNVCKQTCLSQELSVDSLQGETDFYDQINTFVLIATRLLEGEQDIVRLSSSATSSGSSVQSTVMERAAQMLNFNRSMQQLVFSTIDW